MINNEYQTNLETTVTVAQAQGVLMARYDTDITEAERRLIEMADEANVTVAEMAASIVQHRRF